MNLIDEKKVSLLRRYIYEIALMVMGACVAYLFIANSSLNKDLRTILLDVVNKNSNVIQDNTNALREMREEMKEEKRGR